MFTCPRRAENARFYPTSMEEGKDFFRDDDDSCSYCGSLNPDVLMKRLEAGDIEIEATDKNYKMGIIGPGFKQTYRKCPPDCNEYPENCPHWVTRDVQWAKFYFQHFSLEQCSQFIELLNSRRVKFSMGVSFYVMPFFICRAV